MKENEINYEFLKETTLYYCKVRSDNKALGDWLDGNLKKFYLYKLNNHWTLAITDEIINIINNEIIEKTTEYEETLGWDGWLYVRINLLKRILSNLVPLKLTNLELDEFNLIQRNSKIEYNNLLNLKSDISNTGYTSIYLEKEKENSYILRLAISKKGIFYNKKIRVGKRNTLKDALYALIMIKCKILELDCLDEKDIDVSKLYRYATKIGYVNEKHIKASKPISLNYNSFICSRSKPSVAKINIEKATNGTGYKNIHLRLAENKIYLQFTISKKDINLNKRKRIITTDDYCTALKEYISSYCEIFNLKMPVKIDYDTGINSIIKSNIGIVAS
jgi:hypothetical protein